MNRADSGTQADDLPGFLDEGTDAARNETDIAATDATAEAGDAGETILSAEPDSGAATADADDLKPSSWPC